MKLWEKIKQIKNNALEEAVKNNEDNIKKEWKAQWEKEGKEGKVFYEWLMAVLDEIQYKIDKNKKYNNIFKGGYIAYMIVSFVIMVGYIFKAALKQNIFAINSDNIYSILIIIALWLISITFIGKLLLIKKYQETWSRLTGFKGAILSAMLKYLYSISPYDKNTKKEVFIINILKCTESNVDKFQINMEQKETKFLDLPDVLNNIKK